MLNSKKLKKYAIKCGADLVGIGSMDRFEGCPDRFDPRYIMPRAKSIIGLAFRIHRGLFRGFEEGTYFAGYPTMGYANINDVYAPMVMREISSYLEDSSYESLPYINNSVRLGMGMGKAVVAGKPQPDVFLHFRIAGVICGLGEIGYSKIFLTREFGPAQRLAFILTEAELEPDPIVTGVICDRCMSCVRECPAGAISPDKEVEVNIAGHKISWGELNLKKCTAVYQAGTKEISPFMPEEVKQYIDNIVSGVWGNDESEMLDYTNHSDVWDYLKEKYPYIANAWESFHHPAAMCGSRGCIRACLDHLDKKGVLARKFRYSFRDRKPWSIINTKTGKGEDGGIQDDNKKPWMMV